MDNVGAIFVATNITTTCGTKHVNIQYKCVNQYVQDKAVKIIFVKSAKNDNDIFKKI